MIAFFKYIATGKNKKNKALEAVFSILHFIVFS